MDSLLSVDEVVQFYRRRGSNISPRQVHYARKSGKLKAVKFGWVWAFPEKDLPAEWPVRQKRKTA